MAQRKQLQSSTWLRTIELGAVAGIGLTFAYISLFILYAICRSSWTIATTMPLDRNLLGSLAGNATAIVLASNVVASVLTLVMALLGIGTAVAIKGLDSTFNHRHSLWRAIMLGLVAALAFVFAFDFCAQWLMGRTLNSLGTETYLFWFGLPALLHMSAGVVGGWYLHHLNESRRSSSPKSMHIP